MDLIPSNSELIPQHEEQSGPLVSGLPHLPQSGGSIRCRDCMQEGHNKPPHFPQPTHLDGKKKSTTDLLICLAHKTKYQQLSK
jgi:hypothetical protein